VLAPEARDRRTFRPLAVSTILAMSIASLPSATAWRW
jgi:Cu/Ag efflux pump CusA